MHATPTCNLQDRPASSSVVRPSRSKQCCRHSLRSYSLLSISFHPKNCGAPSRVVRASAAATLTQPSTSSVQLDSLLSSLVVALSSLLPLALHILALSNICLKQLQSWYWLWPNLQPRLYSWDRSFPPWSLPFPIVFQHWTTLMSHLHLMERVGPFICSKFKVKTFMLPGNIGFPKKMHFLNCRFEKPGTIVHDYLAMYPVSQNGNSIFGTTFVITQSKHWQEKY